MNQTNHDRMSLPELLAAAMGVGAVAAACFTILDAGYHSPRLAIRDWLIALALAAVPAMFACGVLSLVLRAAAAVLGVALSRQVWFAILAALGVIGLGTSIVLVATNSLRDLRGMLLIVGCAALGGILSVLLVRLGVTRKRWFAAKASFSAFTILVLAALLLGTVRGPIRPSFSKSPKNAAPHAAAGIATAGDRPSVVMVVLDTTRRDMLGCYGSPRGLTPMLDELAKESTIYEHAFAPAHWTVPSHAALFTGLYAQTHGCSYEHKIWLDDEFITLAEMLRDAGYRNTALTSNLYLKTCNLMQGFEHRRLLIGPYDGLAVREAALQLGTPAYWVDKGSAEALNDLHAWMSEQPQNAAPFFLFLNLLEAHWPYLPPLAERREYLPPDTSYFTLSRYIAGLPPLFALHAQASQDAYAIRAARAMYEAEVRYQDRRLAEVFALLKTLPDWKNTLVIVTADHGENLGECGRWGHAFDASDTLLHVPLIIRYPGMVHAGRRVQGLCSLIDVLPTVLEVTGVRHVGTELPGHSLHPDRFQPRKEVIAEAEPFYPFLSGLEAQSNPRTSHAHLRAFRTMIRTDEWKLILRTNGTHELYDLAHDPGETDNVADTNPPIMAELTARLATWRQSHPPYVPRFDEDAAGGKLEEGDVDRLRGLGYVK